MFMPFNKVFTSGVIKRLHGEDSMIEYFAETEFKRRWVLQNEYGQPFDNAWYAAAKVIIRKDFDSPEHVLYFETGTYPPVLSFQFDEHYGFLIMHAEWLDLAPGNYVFQCVFSNPEGFYGSAWQMLESTHLIVYAKHNEQEVKEP